MNSSHHQDGVSPSPMFHGHKLQYKVHTQTGSSVISITLTETTESKQTVEKFIQTLDAEVTEMLKRKLVKFEKIGGEK